MANKAKPAQAAESTDPREQIWNAGEAFTNALWKAHEDACERSAAITREHQKNLLEVQNSTNQRATELYHEYLSALQKAKDSDDAWSLSAQAYQRYCEALAELQTAQEDVKAHGETAQKAFEELAKAYRQSRAAAYADYAAACKKVWSQIDASSLSCESLAFIGQSMRIGAQLVGGAP